MEEADEVEGDASTEAELDVRLSLADVERGLKTIKPDWQEVILLAYVEGLRPREIALIIGKSPATTRVLLHRALQELRKVLNHESRITNKE